MRVKGTLLMDYIRMIRANKDKNWDKYLEEKDWEIVNNRILPSNWYPYDTFSRIGLAVFKEIAGSNLELTRTFGKAVMADLLKIYKNLVVPGDPVASLERHSALHRTFIDAGADARVLETSDKQVKYKITAPPFERGSERALAFAHQIRGNFEGIVEHAGGKNPTTEIESDQDGYVITINWT